MTPPAHEHAQPPFAEGDILPDIVLPSSRAQLVRLSAHVAKAHQVLLFCPDPRLPACRDKLRTFAGRFAELAPLASVFAIANTTPEENAAFLERDPLPFPVLSDLERQVARGLGIAHNVDGPSLPDGADAFSIVVNGVNRRVVTAMRGSREPDPALSVLAFLRSLPRREARRLGRFAPLLYVPQVFERDFCQALIAAFERGESKESGYIRSTGAYGESERVIDRAQKSRRDLKVVDPTLLAGIGRRVDRRLAPEIKKALTRQVTGVEEFKVVRYDAETGGHFSAHRDNTAQRNAHRRFALTLNLNAEDYEGGALRFPEYGPDLYAPDTGDAVVFSCSLLHEATPVVKGRRYALLAFFFDEESSRLNDRVHGGPASP